MQSAPPPWADGLIDGFVIFGQFFTGFNSSVKEKELKDSYKAINENVN